MCEFSQKLIIWLDRELAASESAAMERHIRSCVECQSKIEGYRTLDETIGAYCDAVILSKAKNSGWVKPRAWRLPFVGAAAAAVLLVFLAKPAQRFLGTDSHLANGVSPIAMKGSSVPPIALEKTPIVQTLAAEIPHRTRKRTLLRRAIPVAAAPRRSENLWPSQAPVYIAIPADALFPPGALPEGFGFVADVNLGPDGSAQGLRLQPQLVGFQRRGTQP
jgi:hypothetical protein